MYPTLLFPTIQMARVYYTFLFTSVWWKYERKTLFPLQYSGNFPHSFSPRTDGKKEWVPLTPFPHCTDGEKVSYTLFPLQYGGNMKIYPTLFLPLYSEDKESRGYTFFPSYYDAEKNIQRVRTSTEPKGFPILLMGDELALMIIISQCHSFLTLMVLTYTVGSHQVSSKGKGNDYSNKCLAT